jgi:hypothetical protein
MIERITCRRTISRNVKSLFVFSSENNKTHNTNPPAPACQGPPGCEVFAIHSILYILLSYLSIYPHVHKTSIRNSLAKSPPPTPQEPKKLRRNKAAPVRSYVSGPQDPSIRVVKPLCYGLYPPICLGKPQHLMAWTTQST